MTGLKPGSSILLKSCLDYDLIHKTLCAGDDFIVISIYDDGIAALYSIKLDRVIYYYADAISERLRHPLHDTI